MVNVKTGLLAELVPVKVHEKLLTLPGATVWLIGTTSNELESGSSEPFPMSKNARTESKKDRSAALVVVVESVNSRTPKRTAAAKRLPVVVAQSAD